MKMHESVRGNKFKSRRNSKGKAASARLRQKKKANRRLSANLKKR